MSALSIMCLRNTLLYQNLFAIFNYNALVALRNLLAGHVVMDSVSIVSLDSADANRDGDISIADVTAIVNIILNKE